jgi:hypothetical protein
LGGWGLAPNPKPPIPNPQSPFNYYRYYKILISIFMRNEYKRIL